MMKEEFLHSYDGYDLGFPMERPYGAPKSINGLWATTTATTTPGTEPHKQARSFVALGWFTLWEVPLSFGVGRLG